MTHYRPGFTEKQRKWLLRRDNHQCQFVWVLSSGKTKNCGRTHKPHVHHIVPKLWAYEHLLWKPEKVNAPTNGIVLCKKCHFLLLHPDIGRVAHRMYKYDEEAYKIVTQWHEALAKAGLPYWWTIWDQTFKHIAKVRTRNYLYNNPDDPWPKAKYRGPRK